MATPGGRDTRKLPTEPYPSLPSFPPGVRYLLKKVLSSMSLELGLGELEETAGSRRPRQPEQRGRLSVQQFPGPLQLRPLSTGSWRGDTLSHGIHESTREPSHRAVLEAGQTWLGTRGGPRGGWGGARGCL